MNKTIRSGIDVRVAFTSSAKRMAAIPGSPSQQAAVIASTLSAQRLVSTPQAYSTGSKMLRKIKALLRPAVRAMFRASKPFWRPIAFRVRAYFIAGLPQGPQQELPAILAELTTIKNALREQKDSRRADVNRLDRMEECAFASARRVAVYCGPGEMLVRTEVGYILCSPSDHAVLACLIDSGDLERGTRYLLQNFLKPNNVFIDIGANLGVHTLAAARAMQGQGRIIAFEPFEPTQRLLTKSIWMNGFSAMTEIHQSAVSNRSGHQSLFLGASSGHHSLFQLTATSPPALQPVAVPLVRLDDVVPNSTPVDLIKIDVEGAELDVLESAKSLIASNPSIALIVEFGFTHLARTGNTTQDWLAAFHEVGLVYQAINADTGKLEKWTAAQLEAADSVNLFFARPKSIAWARAGVAP